MASTHRMCWYVSLASIIWTVVWHTLPFIIEFRSRNRVDIISTKAHVRNENNQNVVPILSKQEKINEKYLVYLCDEKGYCGGWGDRQRGIVSLFLLSLVWKRTLKILISSPCDIKPYYKPTNEYNWILTEEELEGLKGKRSKTLHYMNKKKPLYDINLNSLESVEVLYIKNNYFNFSQIVQKYAKALPAYLQNKGRAGIFRESWNRIMIPTDKVLSQVVKIWSSGVINSDAKKTRKELVCAHLRTALPENVHYAYGGFPPVAATKLWNFIDENFHSKSRIFVATDHLGVRNSAISKYGTRFIGSYASNVHPDSMRYNLTLACRSQESAYVDQLMLSKCDVLIYYRRSGFSIHASYLKTEWTNIYSVMRNGNSTFSLVEEHHN
ncbi:hypothetical protein LOTGIDRAFT_173751 [Lottia gigantea]|uniref:O-fucosyltransferase family protein n=1 Tax=Lottia gigantea TaxID=225164 RepID=V4A5Q4_LOTGI|nr:hypothetical protein LOTGIDRAFT_173751 [Lottia gigantea]ESO99263.1 hypothetical protein LOTGIDRAFT_173751 [Lottia gigantea]